MIVSPFREVQIKWAIDLQWCGWVILNIIESNARRESQCVCRVLYVWKSEVEWVGIVRPPPTRALKSSAAQANLTDRVLYVWDSIRADQSYY